MPDETHDAEPRRSRVRFWLLVTLGPVVLLMVYVASAGPVYAIAIRLFGLDAAARFVSIVYYPLVLVSESDAAVRDALSTYVLWWFDVFGISLF